MSDPFNLNGQAVAAQLVEVTRERDALKAQLKELNKAEADAARRYDLLRAVLSYVDTHSEADLPLTLLEAIRREATCRG